MHYGALRAARMSKIQTKIVWKFFILFWFKGLVFSVIILQHLAGQLLMQKCKNKSFDTFFYVALSLMKYVFSVKCRVRSFQVWESKLHLVLGLHGFHLAFFAYLY